MLGLPLITSPDLIYLPVVYSGESNFGFKPRSAVNFDVMFWITQQNVYVGILKVLHDDSIIISLCDFFCE